MLKTKDYIMVFDIETIPDTSITYNLTGFQSENTQELRDKLTDYHMEITDGKNPFLRQLFHKIITISYVKIAIKRTSQIIELIVEDIRSACEVNSSEKDLITWFFLIIDKHQPGLVSFNGRTFDIPVLKYRAMIHGIDGGKFYTSGDKWNNYNQKYNTSYHQDLIDNLSDFGSSAKIKLNEICAVLGYPGKIGISGENIASLYDNGQLIDIRNYCETDALNTYLVYLRYALHSSAIKLESYKNSIKQIKEYIENSKKEHLLRFLEEWKKLSKHSIDHELIFC